MAIKIEIISDTLKRTYSDNNEMNVHKVGTNEVYSEAIDLITSPFEYEEVPKEQEVQQDE